MMPNVKDRSVFVRDLDDCWVFGYNEDEALNKLCQKMNEDDWVDLDGLDVEVYEAEIILGKQNIIDYIDKLSDDYNLPCRLVITKTFSNFMDVNCLWTVNFDKDLIKKHLEDISDFYHGTSLYVVGKRWEKPTYNIKVTRHYYDTYSLES